MLRPVSSAIAPVAAGMIAFSATALAANPPAPPPGSVQVQPVSTSAGGGAASASTGQAWASGDNQSAAHCGLAANAGGTGYSAQPQQVTSTGSSSPDCPTSSGVPSTSGQTNTHGVLLAGGTGTGSNGAASARLALKPAASVSPFASLGRWFGWLLLLLLAAFLFLLLGFAFGRRRRQPVAA